jgi:transposase
MPDLIPLVALLGIDWADQSHEVSLQPVALDASDSAAVERHQLPHTPEAIRAWMGELRARFPAGAVGVAIETSRGPLIHALLDYDWVVLYPVNPRSLARFRATFTPSGAKADAPDADLLRELLAKHRDRLRPWMPDTEATRALRRLVESRRHAVDLRTKFTQQLTAALKEYFPQALEWAGADLGSEMACDFLLAWPTLEAVQRVRPQRLRSFYTRHHCRRPERIEARLTAIREATPLTRDRAVIESGALVVQMLARQLETLGASIRRFDTEIAARFAAHEDAALFSALPGSGAALAPRLLAAFGSDRTRFPHASDVQAFGAIAPVRQRSGKSWVIHWRWSAPTFLRQTFHEFAQQSIRYSAWARAYYALQRSRGKDHHAAVRALAFKWIRVIWRCWQARTPYDEARYLRALADRASPLAGHLPTPSGDSVAA